MIHQWGMPAPYWTCQCAGCVDLRSKGYPDQGPRPSFLLDGKEPKRRETILEIAKAPSPKEVNAMLAINGETQEQRIQRFRIEMAEKRRAEKKISGPRLTFLGAAGNIREP